MSTITDGVYFDMEISYCVLATDHFCSYCQAKSVKHIPERLLACYCTYESPDGSLVAEVCFCPSNSECKKVTHCFNYHYSNICLQVYLHTTIGERFEIFYPVSISINCKIYPLENALHKPIYIDEFN